MMIYKENANIRGKRRKKGGKEENLTVLSGKKRGGGQKYQSFL